MAYILTGHPHAGPFPHLAGEFVGNYREGEKDCADGDFNPLIHRLGRPRATNNRSVSELEAIGWCGKYLLHNDDAWRAITMTGTVGELDGSVIRLKAAGRHWLVDEPSNPSHGNLLTELSLSPADFQEPQTDSSASQQPVVARPTALKRLAWLIRRLNRQGGSE